MASKAGKPDPKSRNTLPLSASAMSEMSSASSASSVASSASTVMSSSTKVEKTLAVRAVHRYLQNEHISTTRQPPMKME
jgi:hypothetical protein